LQCRRGDEHTLARADRAPLRAECAGAGQISSLRSFLRFMVPPQNRPPEIVCEQFDGFRQLGCCQNRARHCPGIVMDSRTDIGKGHRQVVRNFTNMRLGHAKPRAARGAGWCGGSWSAMVEGYASVAEISTCCLDVSYRSRAIYDLRAGRRAMWPCQD